MKFLPGHKGYGPQARTKRFEAVLEKHNFNAAEALVWCFMEAKNNYESAEADSDCSKYLAIASGNAKEIASYVFPKLKSIDKTENVWEGLSLDEKIIAVKDYLVLMEQEKSKK
jgi:hypothetical protein